MNDVNTHAIEVPGYQLVRRIGSGIAASVYLATQRSLERQVAVKVFDAMEDTDVARFERVLGINATLSHPNILRLHKLERTADGRLFCSMPLLRNAGVSLRHLRRKPLKVAAVMRELLEALDHARQRGIVHGHIALSNVLFDAQGQARLADFGIALCASDQDSRRPDKAGPTSTKPVADGQPGKVSDLRDMGLLAYELLTGSPPFGAGNATPLPHAAQAPLQLPPVVRVWQPWLDKALAATPDKGFRSAREMANALSAIDGQRASGSPTRRPPRTRRPKWALATIASVAVLATALAGWAAWGRHPTHAAQRTDAKASLTALPAAASALAATDPAPTTTVAGVSPARSRAMALVAQADALRANGHLFSPNDNNAVRQYLAALSIDPGNPAATKGIDAIMATLRYRIDQAWRDRQLTHTLALLKQSDMLATHAGRWSRRDWQDRRTELAQAVGAAVVTVARKREPDQLDALTPLARALPAVFPANFDLARAERIAAIPLAGSLMQDHRGPLLVYVPAAGDRPAFAIARDDVTRADYAAFAHATGRPQSRCLEAYNPFSRLRRLDWRRPGFRQGPRHPVVCVSWDDAVAYAAWLSRETGETYQLPSNGEWLRAAQGMPKATPCELGDVDDSSRHSIMDNDRWKCDDGAPQTAPVGGYAASAVGARDMYGNVSQWVMGGTSRQRPFRGLSWRDGSQHAPLASQGTADANVGYNSVGFRVLRVIDAAHPAPAAVSGH